MPRLFRFSDITFQDFSLTGKNKMFSMTCGKIPGFLQLSNYFFQTVSAEKYNNFPDFLMNYTSFSCVYTVIEFMFPLESEPVMGYSDHCVKGPVIRLKLSPITGIPTFVRADLQECTLPTNR